MVKQTARGCRGALSLSKPSRLIKDRAPSFWESLLTALEHPDANITEATRFSEGVPAHGKTPLEQVGANGSRCLNSFMAQKPCFQQRILTRA